MRVLLTVVGVFNLLFMAFHITMFWNIAGWHNVPEWLRTSAITFNMLAVLAMAFLGIVFLTRGKEVMATGVGAATLAFAALLYLWRVARDFIWPTSDYTIAAICLVVGVLHLVLLLNVRVRPAPA